MGSNLIQSIIINLVNYGIVLNSILSIRPTKSSIINIYVLQNYERKKKNLANDNDDSAHGQESNLGAVFDLHIKREFEDHDVYATMQTMTSEPYVHHVPVMTGGIRYDGVYNFYKNHFIGKMSDDTKIVRISRTVDKEQVVDEIILSFTHIKKLISYYLAFLLQESM